MVGQPNIFEIIEALKDGRDLLEGPEEVVNSEDGNSESEILRTDET